MKSHRFFIASIAAGVLAQWRGMMAFSLWLKQVLGLLLVAVGGYLIWLA